MPVKKIINNYDSKYFPNTSLYLIRDRLQLYITSKLKPCHLTHVRKGSS